MNNAELIASAIRFFQKAIGSRRKVPVVAMVISDCHGSYDLATKTIFLKTSLIGNDSSDLALKVIFHELIHLWQHRTGRLIHVQHGRAVTFYFEGKDTTGISYKDLPFEEEARRLGSMMEVIFNRYRRGEKYQIREARKLLTIKGLP